MPATVAQNCPKHLRYTSPTPPRKPTDCKKARKAVNGGKSGVSSHQLFLDTFSDRDPYAEFDRYLRTSERKPGQKRPRCQPCQPRLNYVFEPVTRPASYVNMPPFDTLNPRYHCPDLQFSKWEAQILLEMRADYIVKISGSSFNDVCFSWLATAVKSCSNACMLELLEKMTTQRSLHSRPHCPATLHDLSQDMQSCCPTQDCRPVVTRSRAWKAVFADGFNGGWSSSEKLCVVQLLVHFDIPVLSGHLGHCANKQV